MVENKNDDAILEHGEVSLAGTKIEMLSKIDNIFNKFILMVAKYGYPNLNFYLDKGLIIDLYAFRENPELKFVIRFSDEEINSIPLRSLVSHGWIVSKNAIRFSLTQKKLVTDYSETFLENIKGFGCFSFHWEINFYEDD